MQAPESTSPRSHALHDFNTMLAAIGKDPAMLIWLDATENRKAKPNENYAREVMELSPWAEAATPRKTSKKPPAPSPAGPSAATGFSNVSASMTPARSGCPATPYAAWGRHPSDSARPARSHGVPLREAHSPLHQRGRPYLRSAHRGAGEALSRVGLRHQNPFENHFALQLVPERGAPPPTREEPSSSSRPERSDRSRSSSRPSRPTPWHRPVARWAKTLRPLPASRAGGGAAWANSATMLARANFARWPCSPIKTRPAQQATEPRGPGCKNMGVTSLAEACAFLIELLAQDAFDRKVRRSHFSQCQRRPQRASRRLCSPRPNINWPDFIQNLLKLLFR